MASQEEVKSQNQGRRPDSFGRVHSAYLKMRAAGLRTSGGFGIAMVVIAFAVWFAPEAAFPSIPNVIKLFISLSFGFLGLAFWQSRMEFGLPSVEVDTIRREIRLMRGFGRSRRVAGEYKFKELARAERVGNLVRFWDTQGTILADVELRDPATLNSLLSGLRDEGKIA